MKAKLIIAIVALAATMSSCTVFRYHYSEARVATADTEVIVIPPTAKVQVDPVAFQDVWEFKGRELAELQSAGISQDALRDRLKVAASYKSLQKHEGDIVVAPIYDVRSDRDGGRYMVTIRGYMGRYVDWNKDSEEVLDLEKTTLGLEKRVEVYTK